MFVSSNLFCTTLCTNVGNRVCQLANTTTVPQLTLLFQSVFGTNHLVCLVLKPISHYSLALTSVYADYGPLHARSP